MESREFWEGIRGILGQNLGLILGRICGNFGAVLGWNSRHFGAVLGQNLGLFRGFWGCFGAEFGLFWGFWGLARPRAPGIPAPAQNRSQNAPNSPQIRAGHLEEGEVLVLVDLHGQDGVPGGLGEPPQPHLGVEEIHHRFLGGNPGISGQNGRNSRVSGQKNGNLGQKNENVGQKKGNFGGFGGFEAPRPHPGVEEIHHRLLGGNAGILGQNK